MGFTIKELEALSGIKSHTIRVWEQRYGFLKPDRTATNIRTYSNEELKTLLTVALLNKYGYKISRIDSMPPQQRNQEVLELPVGEAHDEALVNELIGCMIDMDIRGFEAHLNRDIQQKGIEQTITSIIFFFLQKTGILWQTGRIHPAHEHLVSNVIRQKIVAAIEALPLPQRDAPLFLLLLPEDEHHELGLLYVSYLLKTRGLPVLYLGANVPLKDARYVIELKRPAYVYLHLTATPPRGALRKFLQALNGKEDCRILLSGAAAEAFSKAPASHIFPLQSLSQVVSYLSEI
jgi:MerR family transcriptional regulator, light-induced transcriptional regulator